MPKHKQKPPPRLTHVNEKEGKKNAIRRTLLLILCACILPMLATTTANAASISSSLEVPNTATDNVHADIAYTFHNGGSQNFTRVTGPFTIKLTTGQPVTGFATNVNLRIATSGAGSGYPEGAATFGNWVVDGTDSKIWRITVTPTTAGAFQIREVFPLVGIDAGTGNTLSWGIFRSLIHYDAPPAFTSGNSADSFATHAVSVAENSGATVNVATLAASDANHYTPGAMHTSVAAAHRDPVSYAISTTEGVDRAKFIIADTNKLRFASGFTPNYENAQDVVSTDPANAATNNEYIVVVVASSGQSPVQTAKQTVTVTITDANEPPSAPAAPTVTAANATPNQLSVSWTAPTNTGPAINDYDMRWRTGSGSWQIPVITGTGTTATITGLTQNTAYQVQIRATNAEGSSGWSATGTATTKANVAPTFSSADTAFNVAENTTTVTTATATDADTVVADTVSYAITGGADSGKFSIVSTTGAVTFSTAPDYEDPTDVQSTNPANAAGNNVYIVTVTATSGTGGRALSVSKTLVVTVTDVDSPGTPTAPTVTAENTTPTQLSVTWTALTATPAVTDYDVQYREGTSGNFTAFDHTGTSTSATITGLTPGTAHQVQVRATNVEGTGAWSPSGSATTKANVAPTFSSIGTAFSVAENATAVTTATATDSDTVVTDTVSYAITGGADSGKFSIASTTGAVTFSTAPDYENPTDVQSTNPTSAANDNVYIVTITATSGTGGRALTVSKTLVVSVTDETEPPGKPAQPTVTAPHATPRKLTVTWTAPTNTGPAITDYDVQYRTSAIPTTMPPTTAGAWVDAGYTGATPPSTPITLSSLMRGTSYDVQVRATNAEGDSAWSDSRTISTATNAFPVFTTSSTNFSVAENTTTVATVTATDADAGDTVRYSINSGNDSAKFAVDANTGAVTFITAPNYEDPQDVAVTSPEANAAMNNEYFVTIRATSGTGERMLSSTYPLIAAVTDDDTEAPGTPDRLSVTGTDVTEISVSWTEPTNAGPAIDGYDVQYRTSAVPGTPAGSWQAVTHTGTGRTATVTGLTTYGRYDIQVRAKSPEGMSSWTPAVTAIAQANEPPTFSSPDFSSEVDIEVAENTPAGTTIVTFVAADPDPDDNITGYTLSGPDVNAFTLNANSGALRFRASPDFEAPTDVAYNTGDAMLSNAAGNNVYVIEITAMSGSGVRQMSSAMRRLTITVTNVDEMGIGLAIGSSVAADDTDGRRVTSEPSWTVTFDFGEPLVLTGEEAFALSDINVSVNGDSNVNVNDDVTFGELTLSDAAEAIYTVPVTVTAEGAYTFTVKSGSVATAATGDTYGDAGTPLVVIYNTPPVITNVEAGEAPDDGYTVGSEITLELTFDDDDVDIPAGLAREERPYIVLYLDDNPEKAYWKSARDANSTIVTFAYQVQQDDFANSIRWTRQLVVPETAPITNGVSGINPEAPGDAEDFVVAVESQDAPVVTPPAPPERPDPALTQDATVGVPPIFVVLPPTEEETREVRPTQIPRTPLIFNEIGNGAAGANDWLELRNVTGAAVPLKDWHISIVADGEKADKPLVIFPSDVAFSIPANGLLLLTQRPPDKTRLAGGVDIAAANPAKKGSAHHYFVASDLRLPDDGQFLLILRNAKEKLGTGENVIDVAGGGGANTDAFIADAANAFQTDIWPLRATKHPRANTESALAGGKVWARAKANIVGFHKDAWAQARFTGIGYKRGAETSPALAGTPGYPNDALKTVAATGSVTFSEVMLDSAGGTLPQWIELYNSSKTAAVNLNRWKLEIQNVDTEALVGRPIVTLTLQEKIIQPNQTLLIVTGPARAGAASADVFPGTRVYNLLQLHQKNLRINRASDTFLSPVGFTLKLSDRTGKLVDEIGNTAGNRRPDAVPRWALPQPLADSPRSSIIRRYEKDVAEDGKSRLGWVLAANINRFSADVYYGHKEDIGTPGYREGGAVPVELTHFSVARIEAGVVIKWATASEVDNAGFTLLRSEAGKSEFRVITPRLILGAGTTGERQDYAFTDASAKPGVAYVYRLEDVSLSGQRQLLASQRVKAGLSAAGRHLTTFGEVKQRE